MIRNSIPSCRPSLGLGNPSQSREPEARRLGTTQNAAHRARPMIYYPPVSPLWGSEISLMVGRFVLKVLRIDAHGCQIEQATEQATQQHNDAQ